MRPWFPPADPDTPPWHAPGVKGWLSGMLGAACLLGLYALVFLGPWVVLGVGLWWLFGR